MLPRQPWNPPRQDGYGSWPSPAWASFWLPLGSSLLMATPPAHAQPIGPGSFTSTQTVTSGIHNAQAPLTIDAASGHALEVGGTGFVNMGSGVVRLQSQDNLAAALLLRDEGLVRNIGGRGVNLFITSSGAQSSAIELRGTSLLDLIDVSIHTTGAYAQAGGSGVSASYGVLAGAGSSATLANATILTEGEGADGAFASGGSLILSDTAIHTTATTAAVAASGARQGAAGVRAGGGGQFALSRTIVITEGELSHGVLADGVGTLGKAESLSVQTNGPGAYGVSVSDGGAIVLSNAILRTAGSAAYGLDIEGGAVAELTGASIATKGAGAHGVVMRAAPGVGNQLSASNLHLSVANGAAFSVIGGTGTIRLENAVSQSGSGQFLLAGSMAAAGSTTVNLTARDSTLEGNTWIGSDATANLTLEGASNLVGAIATQGASVLALNQGASWKMTGSSSVTRLVQNNGSTLFSAPSGGSFKTLTVRDLAGAGNSAIGLNTYLAGDASPTDRIVIEGGAATGKTALRIMNAGGGGAHTKANGIRVVQTANGATTGGSAFSLQGRAVAGPYEYGLYKGDSSGAGEDWYLRSGKQGGTSTPGGGGQAPAPEPLYRPEVAAYLANQRLVGQMLIQTMNDRFGDPQAGGARLPALDGGRRSSLWLRATQTWEHSHSRDGEFDVGADMFSLRGGGDIAQWKLFSEAGRLRLGAMLGYGLADSTARADANPHKARGKVQGYSAGIYGTWFQDDESRLGAYADTWFQYGWFNNKVAGADLPRVDYDSRAWAVSAETGYAFGLRGGWVLEPQAQLIYVETDARSVTEENGTRVDRADTDGTITRLGVRVRTAFDMGNGRQVRPFGAVNWWHGKNSGSVSFNELSIGELYPQDRYELKLGVQADFANGWTGWINASGSRGAQDYRQYAARIGAAYVW